MRLPRELIHAVPWPGELRYDLSPIQLGLGASPWHVTVASMLMVRVPRRRDVIRHVFDEWPTPDALSCSDTALVDSLRPLGLHQQRARQLQQLCRRWHTDTWQDLRELKGVGLYVTAAVELFCFNNGEHAHHDHVLSGWACHPERPSIDFAVFDEGDVWRVGEDTFTNSVDAYAAFAARSVRC